MSTKIQLKTIYPVMIILLTVTGQWLTYHVGAVSGVICLLLVVILLAGVGNEVLSRNRPFKWWTILLGVLGMVPLNLFGLFSTLTSLLPISNRQIVFLNVHYQLVIGGGILATILIWSALTWAVSRYWQIPWFSTAIHVAKVAGLLLLTILICGGILLLLANWGQQKWLTSILNGILITGLTAGQLWLLLTWWSGNIPVKWQVNGYELVIGGILAVGVGANLTSMVINQEGPQKIIAHRGTYTKNQLPNSISALIQTSQKDFNLVEMDVRETKDHYFICQHNDEMKLGPTKQAAIVEKLTLKQIRQQQKVELFSDYIKTANRLGQRLLVELKPSGDPRQKTGTDFVKQFQTAMLINRGLIHSMSPEYLQQVKRVNSRIPTGLVMTINVGDLNRYPVDFYSIQSFTLTPAFIRQARNEHRPVYAWTVRRKMQSRILKMVPIQGQITDDGLAVRQIQKQKDNGHAQILLATAWNYL